MADTGQGYKYQLSVTAYLASVLSKNESVKDYRIYYEVKDLEPFDDIVLAVVYNGSEDYFFYFVQVKSGTRATLDVDKYLKGYKKIKQYEQWDFLNDIDKINLENIQFWFFASKDFSKNKNITFTEDSKIKKLELKDRQSKHNKSAMDERFTKYYKLCLKDDNITTKHQHFFNNFYIYSGQLDEQGLLNVLSVTWKLDKPEEIISYLDKYLVTKKNYRISKTVFEHALLQQRLSKYIVTPIKAIPVKKERAEVWINLTLEHHVTIIENTSHTKPCLFGCILTKIGNLITMDEWNECVSKEGKLSEDLKTKFASMAFDGQTIGELVIYLWMSDKIPLILEAEYDLSALKEFSDLIRHYIIIDSKLNKRYDEMKSYNLSVIKDLGGLQVDELLQSISVSMQGKKPTSLYEVINDDKSLLETLTSSDILKLIEPKRVYLKDECFKNGSDMLFIIEAAITEGYEKTIENNILMYCLRNQGDLCYQKAVQNPKFKNYKIYRLYAQHSENGEEKFSLTNEYKSNEVQLIEARDIVENNSTEEYRGLEYFLVDQHGDNVYRENEDEGVPVVGEMVNMSCPRYLSRRMRKITTKQVKNTSSTDNNTNSVIECTEESFSENDFFIRSTLKICGICGVPGIGKSTFLRSLARICDPEYYVLFYDLGVDQRDLCDKNKKQSEFCKDPLKLLCNKNNSLPYNKFLSRLKKDRKRLIIILDSLDEVVATCKDNVLKLIDKLNREPFLSKIIVGSRSLTVSLLCNQFDVDLVEIDGLTNDWNIDYLQNWNINENYIGTMPAEFLENPLYLNFLRIIAVSNVNMENLNRWSLYKTIIDLNIDRYYERRIDIPDVTERNNLLKYCYALAFQAFFPGHEITRKLTENIKEKYTNFLRIGIIKCFNKRGVPVFVHRTFLEFLVSRWLLETSDKEDAEYIYQYILRNKMYDILDTHSEQFRLHKAVIDKDVTQVHTLCKENSELLNEVDGLGRTALHMAIMESFTVENSEIFTIIFQNMVRKDFNLYPCDKLLNWTWADYCHIFVYSDLYRFDCLLNFVLEEYWRYQYRIKNKSDWIFIDDERFSICCRQAFEIPSINMIQNLISLKYYNNKSLIEVDELCSSLEITATALPKSTMPELGTTLMHLGCIYSNINIVSACIDRGDDVNARDRFGCTPLYYGVCSQTIEIVGLLLAKGANMKLHPTNLAFTTLFAMSLQMQNKSIMKMLIDVMDKSFESWEFSTPIHDAVRKGNIQVVETFLTAGVNVNIQDADGDAPLHYAVRCRNKDLIQLLTQYHANLNMINKRGQTPLFDALKKRDEQLMEMLLYLGADVNIVDKEGNTLLAFAVKYKYNEELNQLLLQYGADVNCTDSIGETPLFHAVDTDNTRMIKILLNADANVNIQNIYGNTVLIRSVDIYKSKENSNIQMIKMFVDANANLNIDNIWGDTPLHIAGRGRTEDIVRLLVQHRARACATNNQQETPLFLAVVKQKIGIINILLSEEVNLNMSDEDGARLILPETNDNISCKYKMYVNMESQSGDTPLCCAIKKGNVDIVKKLLENGADVNYVDKNGCHLTPLFVAIETQNVEVVEILLRKGAEVNFQSKYDVTPLYVAVLIGNLNMVKLLLEYKAHPNIVTPIDTSFVRAKQIDDIDGALWLLNCLVQRSVNSLNDETFSNDVKHFIQTVEQQVDINFVNEMYLDRKETNADLANRLLIAAVDVEDPTPIGIKCLDAVLELNDKEVDGILLINFERIYSNHIKRYTDVGYAAIEKNRAMVKISLRNRQPTDNTFLTRIIKYFSDKCPVKILLENQIDVNLPDKAGDTPLITATEYGRLDVLQILLDNGADVNGVNNQVHGRTPLSVAIAYDKSEFVRMLLHNGANIKIGTKSMLHYAVRYSSKSTICMLLEYGADPNERNEYGKGALHYAVQKGRKDIIKKLLKFKAVVNITDTNFLSPLDYAIRRRRYDIISILQQREKGADNFGDSNDGNSNSESGSDDEGSNNDSGSDGLDLYLESDSDSDSS